MARVLVGDRKGNEYALHGDSLSACRRICEACMRAYAMDVGAPPAEDASGLLVSRLNGGTHKSFLVESGGVKYVVKQTFHKNREFYLKRLLFGSESRKMIASMRKALGRGCDLFQKTLYLFECRSVVDDQVCIEMWSVADFIEGEVLLYRPDLQDFCGKVADLLAEIARCGVFQTDLHSGNFIVVEDGGVKALDIRISNSPELSLVCRMAYKCRRFLGMPLPRGGFGFWKKAAAFLGDTAFSLWGERRVFK